MRMMVFAAAIAYGVAGAPEGEKLGVEDRISSGGLQMLGIASKGMREEAEREEAAEAAARRRAEFLAAQMQRIKAKIHTDINCVEENQDYPGYDINLIVRDDLTKEECSFFCIENHDCTAWLFKENHRGNQNWCWLKKAIGAKSAMPGAWSGAKKCWYPDCKPHGCSTDYIIEENIDFYGNDIRNIKSSDMTQAKCSCECSSTTGCKAWLFIKGADGLNVCYLKTAAANRRPLQGGVAGSTSCQPSRDAVCRPYACNTDYSIEADVDYFGNDIRNIKSSDMTQAKCSCECSSTTGCKAWLFIKDIGVEGLGGDVEGLRGDVSFVKPKFHQELRSSAPSDSTENFAGAGGLNACYLKTAAANRRHFPGAIAGSTSCKLPGWGFCRETVCKTDYAIEKDIDYIGNDIGTFSSSGMTEYECSCKCTAWGGCNAWLFKENHRVGQNTCWLKSSADNIQPTSLPGAVSGKSTPSSFSCLN